MTFFFEGAPSVPGAPQAKGSKPSPAYVTDFLGTRDGHALIKAFMQIKDTKLRRHRSAPAPWPVLGLPSKGGSWWQWPQRKPAREGGRAPYIGAGVSMANS